MPEHSTTATPARSETATGQHLEEGSTPPAPPRSEAGERTSWLFYGLGLSLQVFLWFLLFLGLVIAIAVGGELTEFRYVGF